MINLIFSDRNCGGIGISYFRTQIGDLGFEIFGTKFREEGGWKRVPLTSDCPAPFWVVENGVFAAENKIESAT